MAATYTSRGLLLSFLRTSVGRKTAMSITGLGAISFLLVHLLGNSALIKGPAAFDAYAHSLHSLPFLPLLEIGLGLLFFAHVSMALVLTLRNAAARPIRYAVAGSAGARTFASRTMIYTGLAVLAYMLLHLWTMKFGPDRALPAFQRVQAALTDPWVAACYLAGLAALGIHLSHGASSALLSLGLRHPLHDPWVDRMGKTAALAMGLAFAAIVGWFLFWGGPAPFPEVASGQESGHGREVHAVRTAGGTGAAHVVTAEMLSR